MQCPVHRHECLLDGKGPGEVGDGPRRRGQPYPVDLDDVLRGKGCDMDVHARTSAPATGTISATITPATPSPEPVRSHTSRPNATVANASPQAEAVRAAHNRR